MTRTKTKPVRVPIADAVLLETLRVRYGKATTGDVITMILDNQIRLPRDSESPQ